MQGQQSATGSTVTSPQHDGRSAPPPTIKEVPDESASDIIYCIPWIEACALVTLCSYRSVTRKLSLALLKETRILHEAFGVQVRENLKGLRLVSNPKPSGILFST